MRLTGEGGRSEGGRTCEEGRVCDQRGGGEDGGGRTYEEGRV